MLPHASGRSAGAARCRRPRSSAPRPSRSRCVIARRASERGSLPRQPLQLRRLITFAIAQAAVVALRFTEPDLPRPFVVPSTCGSAAARARRRAVGIPLVAALWVISFSTHAAARIGGPAWLLLGACLYVYARVRRGAGLLERVAAPVPDLVPAGEGEYERILVPVKLGPIGEEMLATAIKLAEERGGTIHALHVIRVPLSLPLDAEVADQQERASASLDDARTLAGEHGVTIEGDTVRARSIGEAIVEKAGEIGADLIVMGSAPRWRRQSRFFSPTVDYVLRRAPSEVMVIAYPQGVLDEELLG
jgi:APA family basic amino acid/polyamine antiporter